ncbi:MAG: carbohydrate kinase family protein [Candidatus Microsaccharimonas sossegonensis]|uniref:Carbohydrate kinase family protein n=1 Tax=Candidatus Microsaccharimonas sossegonensis TaxID=2506948 RepID=A0A4Q0AIM4_9BACT|nr:MAG: carbohydrate kinase family protein [Candidatus Microsaccharimonas sossegonensis]
MSASSHITIITIGKATQDVFVKSSKSFKQQITKGVVYDQLPVGQKLDLDDVVFSTGGNVTNAAVTFARQGLHSRYMWCIGTDVASEAILQELDRDGVDTKYVVQKEDYHASYSVILMLAGGERTILNYKGTKVASTSRDLDFSIIETGDWLYLSALGDMELLEKVITHAAKHGVKVMLNPSGAELKEAAKLRTVLEDVEILAVNKEEAMQIVTGESMEELVRHAHHYCPIVIVSDGPHGAWATDGKTIIEAGMYEDVPVVDRTGGGDAFGSGFLSQWAQGKTLKDAMVFASANSTSVVTKIGAKEGILYSGVVLHDMPIKERQF